VFTLWSSWLWNTIIVLIILPRRTPVVLFAKIYIVINFPPRTKLFLTFGRITVICDRCFSSTELCSWHILPLDIFVHQPWVTMRNFKSWANVQYSSINVWCLVSVLQLLKLEFLYHKCLSHCLTLFSNVAMVPNCSGNHQTAHWLLTSVAIAASLYSKQSFRNDFAMKM
jgi:hypothetical protein